MGHGTDEAAVVMDTMQTRGSWSLPVWRSPLAVPGRPRIHKHCLGPQ
jgi:hypothetical protein